MPTVIGGPSLHLCWSELKCHDGTPYPPEWRKDRAVVLADAFEVIRAIWGKPIMVLSGYRTPAYNAACGGATHSQHVEGRALDLKPPDGVTVYDFWNEILRIAMKTAIRGVGYACPSQGGYVHIDIRPSLTLVQWTYPIR